MLRRPEPAPGYAQLEAIAVESSEREREADRAERELLDWKKMILMERHLGDTFDALIIAVWKDGFTVELADQFIEGFVPVAEIAGDSYQLDTGIRALVGRRSGRSVPPGRSNSGSGHARRQAFAPRLFFAGLGTKSRFTLESDVWVLVRWPA